MIPKVFVSHASEDKDRFVLNFATQLRANGIDAWVDKWEMVPGDSLVDKIFEEGIKNAKAVIIVISKNSIKKPWVREELNASVIKRINTGSKLIPVIIDNCDVPECLKSTVWQPINDINNYDEELSRIIMSILGENDKPPIGKLPKYANTLVDIIPNLTKVDNIVFKAACENAIKDNSVNQIDSKDIFNEVNKLGIDYTSFLETLDILDHRGYIKAIRVIGGDIPIFNITIHGFNDYVRLYVENFEGIMNDTCFYIVNEGLDNITIATKLDKPLVLINHVLNLLKQRGLINFTMTLNGGVFIHKVSPELKRMLQ